MSLVSVRLIHSLFKTKTLSSTSLCLPTPPAPPPLNSEGASELLGPVKTLQWFSLGLETALG